MSGITRHDNDVRLKDKTQKLLKSVKFPQILQEPLDISKVNLDVMRPWITTKITELLGFEDDITVELVVGLLQQKMDPREIQIQLTGFLEDSTFKFMKSLWELLLSAQKSVSGIPQAFLDAKKEEIRLQRERDALIGKSVEERRHRERSTSRDRHRRHRSRSRERRDYRETERGYRDRRERDDDRRQSHRPRRADSQDRMYRGNSRERYRSRDSSRDRHRRDVSHERHEAPAPEPRREVPSPRETPTGVYLPRSERYRRDEPREQPRYARPREYY
ncbi:hypothetical protein HDU91_002108 [Kappamyces sp. JEL0680]|nr:hypothetical protein HDU91_002108 [Kappamyces sp. JEL0680]